MALFQNAVIKKYLQAQNKEQLSEKWLQFKNHFHNPTIQDNIRSSKEEQYQGEFLIDLFVNVLGYTKNPQPDFNLTTEYKNVKDSKKADGAILIDNKVSAVIELKGTNTTDLSKIETQAFGYKNNQPDCVYIITSNFEKLRFYIDNAIEYLEFNLFQLQPNEFELLYLCLAHENIAKGIAKKLKDESVSQEDVITKKLYKDYSTFKRALYHSLVQLNPEYEPIALFEKSQKLLDRFLFIFFAEDRQLLPPNSVRLILQQWNQLKELDEEVPLYERFKKYFGYLNTGYKGKNFDVYAYNGGLFKADELLDNIKIDDALLYAHTLKLSEYDFASEVDVNILGHIFENSLNELDEIKAELEGEVIDKTKTKRKKDGVFYTPKYITKYIVENTIGKLCNEKKIELQLNEEDYTNDKKRQKKTLQGLIDKLQLYRNWLLQLTICDPACGSGAFLNQALDFLIEEHKYIDELQAKLFGDTFILSDVENSILENNLFGVDLNEESVEIAKLSLWLRTALPNRKLNDLSGNIKCGNSLIDDPEIAGEKAFNWQTAFPQVFAKGGFDVIIGNPPYVTNKLGKNNESSLDIEMEFYKLKYGNIVEYKGNLFSLFIGKTNEIIKLDGLFSFIIPNSILFNSTFSNIRNYIIKEFNFLELLNLKYEPFSDANTGGCLIFLFQKNKKYKETRIIEYENESGFFEVKSKSKSYDFLKNIEITNGKFLTQIENIEIIKKCYKDTLQLGEIMKFYQGIITGDNKKFISNVKEHEKYKPILRGADIHRYSYAFSENYVLFDKEQLWSNTNEEIFETKPKLINRQTGSNLTVCLDESGYYALDSTHSQTLINDKFNIKFILVIENSKLFNFIYNFNVNEGGRTFAQVKTVNLKTLPVKKINEEAQLPFIEKAEQMLSLSKDFQEILSRFQRTLQRKFELESLPKKLENWYELTFAEFVKELAKKKVKLTLSDEAEWEDYFLQEQLKAVATKNEITATDKAIDAMVYELYGLTEEEISIVENS